MTATDPLRTTRDSAQAFEDRLAFFADGSSIGDRIVLGFEQQLAKPGPNTTIYNTDGITATDLAAVEAMQHPDPARIAARVAHGYQDEAR